MRRAALTVPPVAILTALLAACGGADSGDAAGAGDPVTVTVVTHESFVLSEQVLADFAAETGITIEVAASGDAGALVNRAVLAAGKPEGDVIFGVDNTLLSRLLASGAVADYRSEAADPPLPTALTDLGGDAVTPIDYGDVCLNVDAAWYADRQLAAPSGLADLADPAYRDQFVMPNPATSSPGLAYLMATVAAFGDPTAEEQPAAWVDYWQDLRANGMQVVSGWTEAYTGSYTAGGGNGDRPVVVSYATSPPAELVFASEPKPQRPRTTVLTDGCFRQVEFAGVLAGTDQPAAARQVVDFLLSDPVQADVPLSMFVFPAVPETPLPAEFAFAATPSDPVVLQPEVIDAGRDAWIEQWTGIVLR